MKDLGFVYIFKGFLETILKEKKTESFNLRSS